MSLTLLNRSRIQIRWNDLDMYTHLNNSVYYDLMAEARIRLFTRRIKNGSTEGYQHVVAENGCKFLRPYCKLDDLMVLQYCEKIGNTSYHLRYHIVDVDDHSIIYADGFARMVYFNPKTQKPERLTDEMREALQTDLADHHA